MAMNTKEMLEKAKQKEAAARAEKRRVLKLIMDERAKTFTKYFPEVEDADDVDAFMVEVRKRYDSYAPRESSHTAAPQVQPKPYKSVTDDDGFLFPDD